MKRRSTPSAWMVSSAALLVWVSAGSALRTGAESVPAARTSASQSYILSPDDQINITVLGHTDLNMAMTILPDGTFNYPIAGTVHAAGLTVHALTDRLVQGLSTNLNAPRVTVSVVQSRPRRISVVGDVKNPGLYDVKQQWSVLDAIAASGGLAHVPEMTRATLMSEGGKKSTQIDIAKLMSGSDPAANFAVSPGDILMVQLRDSNTALVQVTGEVSKPGQYVVPSDGAAVLPMLVQAGGPTPNAALSRVQILHAGQVRTVNLRQGMNDLGDPVNSLRLMEGDVLLVPTNKAKIAIMGEVKDPSVQVIPDGETMPIANAISLAGGLTDDGDRAKVNIVRADSDGKTSVREIDLNKSLISSGASAMNLQPGDVLYIPTRRKGHGANESGSLIAGLAAMARLLF